MVYRAMRERKGAFLEAQGGQDRAVRQRPEAENSGEVRHGDDLREEESRTAPDLGSVRLVFWWNASHRVRNAAPDQPESVVGSAVI